MVNSICGALLIAAIITLASLPLISRQLHSRHSRQLRHDAEAQFWIRELRPDRSLAALRLRRDLRPWISRRRLP